MDYKNLVFRSFFSIFFLMIYLIISLVYFNLLFYLIILVYLLIILEVLFNFKSYRIIPVLYILISLIFFLFIDFEKLNFLQFNLFICTVIFFDIFSYIIGKSFGKIKLTKISPNKTCEGLLGGALFALTLSLLIAYLSNITVNINLLYFILLNILFAFIGDILESYFKRKNELKNSSELIPGHGGVFDRFDSFLFSIIFYSISFNI